MKICFYNHTGQVSGAEKVLFSILSALDPNEYDAVVLAPKSQNFESFCQERSLAFYPVNALEARYTLNPKRLAFYLLSFMSLIRELRQHLRRESPDLVHANTTRAAIVATLATIGIQIQVFWHVHDMMPRHPLSSLIRLLAILSGRNRIIAVSQATADRFTGRLPQRLRARAPVEVIHNGIDTKRFTPSRDGVLPFLEKIGLHPSHFRIGIVGQITPRKGHLELIRNLAPVFKTTLPNARLLVVGSAMFNKDHLYLELLRSETRRLGIEKQVLFLGACNVPIVMRALNVLVLNSSSEPFGLVLTEAMASGTPVIAAAVDGVPEIIENGVSGLLFEPGDWKTFASHLMKLSTNKKLVETLVREGRSRVTALFNQERLQSKMFALYKAVDFTPGHRLLLSNSCESSNSIDGLP